MPRLLPDPDLERQGYVRISNGFLRGTSVMHREAWEKMERARLRREKAAREARRLKNRLKRAAKKRARKLAGNAKKARLKDPRHCRHKRERTVTKTFSGRRVRKCANCGRERPA